MQQNKPLGRVFYLAVSLLVWLSLLSVAALLRPSGFDRVQAARSAASPLSAQAGLRSAALAAKIIYVNQHATVLGDGTSWAKAFTDLQAALDIAIDTNQIWVAAGVYTPTRMILLTDTRTATFSLLEAVEVYGSFKGNETSLSQRSWRANPSILSGDLNGDDVASDFPDGPTYSENSYHIVTAHYLNKPTRLDGFIIQGGNANADEARPPFNFGGGLYNRESETNLVNLIFYKNHADIGGGIYNVDTYSQIINCAFIGNKSDFGGGLRNITSNTTLINTVFVGNSAIRAGAIYNSSSNPNIENITVAYNFGDDQINPEELRIGGIFSDKNSHFILKNSILWGNYPNQIKNESIDPSSSAELYFSLVQDDCTGFGNTCTGVSLTVDPGFENPPGLDGIFGTLDDNLRLNRTSPAIDAGDNSVVPLDYLDINYNGIINEALPLDLNNTRRFIQVGGSYIGLGTPPIVDMGAYETKCPVFLPLIRK
jgi:hypothetical protein